MTLCKDYANTQRVWYCGTCSPIVRFNTSNSFAITLSS